MFTAVETSFFEFKKKKVISEIDSWKQKATIFTVRRFQQCPQGSLWEPVLFKVLRHPYLEKGISGELIINNTNSSKLSGSKGNSDELWNPVEYCHNLELGKQ